MKEQEIQAFLASKKIVFAKHKTIWATIVPSVGAYQNGIGKTMHLMKDHILHFNPKGIAIIAVDDMNGKLKEDSFSFLPKKEIVSTQIKTKLTKFILIIDTEKGEITYKIRKSILACPWHKENLSFLLLESMQNTTKEIRS